MKFGKQPICYFCGLGFYDEVPVKQSEDGTWTCEECDKLNKIEEAKQNEEK